MIRRCIDFIKEKERERVQIRGMTTKLKIRKSSPAQRHKPVTPGSAQEAEAGDSLLL